MPTAITSVPQRKRRFERTSDRVPFQLTERDLQILYEIGKHRFLNSVQIHALIGGSADKLLRRLEAMYHTAYLDRPLAQLDKYQRKGAKPYVYALDNRGARVLNERFAATFPDVNWKHKNSTVGQPFIEHTLAVADAHIAAQVATRTRPEIEMLAAEALIAQFPTPPLSPDRAFLQTVDVRYNDDIVRISVNPDLVFALRSPTVSKRCYLVECDRGTMPVHRSNLKMSSLTRKMRGYVAAYSARLHERLFGWKAHRVLFIVNTAERAVNARRELQTVTAAPQLRQLFYFTDMQSLRAGDMLTHPWIDGNDNAQTLI